MGCFGLRVHFCHLELDCSTLSHLSWRILPVPVPLISLTVCVEDQKSTQNVLKKRKKPTHTLYGTVYKVFLWHRVHFWHLQPDYGTLSCLTPHIIPLPVPWSHNISDWRTKNQPKKCSNTQKMDYKPIRSLCIKVFRGLEFISGTYSLITALYHACPTRHILRLLVFLKSLCLWPEDQTI